MQALIALPKKAAGSCPNIHTLKCVLNYASVAVSGTC